MTPPNPPATAVNPPTDMTPNRPTARPGFTFIEVMFAVIVLGIGVIMIAAMLPVAIRTATETREAATGATAIETGFHLVEAAEVARQTGPVAQVVTWPAHDTAVISGSNPLGFAAGLSVDSLQLTAGDRVLTAEPQFMWLPFVYKPAENAPTSLALVAARARNLEGQGFPTDPTADPALYEAFFDYATPSGSLRLDNYPLPVNVTTRLGTPENTDEDTNFPDDLYVVRLSERGGSGLPGNAQIEQAMTEGAAVVVVDGMGRLRVYRVGVFDEESTNAEGQRTWFLAPGAELDRSRIFANGGDDPSRDFGSPDEVTSVPGYLIGRALADPRLAWDEDDNPHVGPSQVVGHLGGTPLP